MAWWGAVLLLAAAGCDGSAPVTREPPAGWPTGRTLTYHVDLESTSRILGAAAPAEWAMSLRAEATVRPRAAESLVVALREPTLSARGGDPAEMDPLEAELSQPFGIELRSGRVAELRLSRQLSPEATGMLRTLAASLQRPKGAGPVAKVEEHDATGRYEAEYRVEDGALRKTKKRYLSVLIPAGSGAAAPKPPRVEASRGVIHLDDDGAVERLDLEETVRAELPASGAVTVRTSLRWRRSSAEPRDREAPSLPESPVVLVATEPLERMATRDRFDAVRARDASIEEALDAFAARAAAAEGRVRDKEANRAKIEAFSVVVALLRRDPAHVPRVVERADEDASLARPLFHALASAGTDEAQRALVDLVQGEGRTPELRRAAADSAIRVKKPSPALIGLLEALVDDPRLREHGILGLGTAARRLREAGHAERARDVAKTLGRLLEEARNDKRRITVLRGIANATDAFLFDRARPYLTHDAASVREAALHAIQRMGHAKVNALLAERLRKDASASVRRTAAQSAALRDPSGRSLRRRHRTSHCSPASLLP